MNQANHNSSYERKSMLLVICTPFNHCQSPFEQVGRDSSETCSLLVRLRVISDELLPLGHRVTALRRTAEELVGGSPSPEEPPDDSKSTKRIEPTSKHSAPLVNGTQSQSTDSMHNAYAFVRYFYVL